MADLTVLLVDDEALVRAGLRLLLDGTSGIRVIGEAEDGGQAIAFVRETRPDVVLMDIRMPRIDGIAAAEVLLSAHPGLAVIMLTTFDADETVLGALQAGAQGFLLKDTPPGELIDAIHRVAEGRVMLSPSVTRQVVSAATQRASTDRASDAQERLQRLTPRERDVAEAIARGGGNADIAAELHLGLATVKTHVRRIMEKLSAENRVQIAICVHEAQG